MPLLLDSPAKPFLQLLQPLNAGINADVVMAATESQQPQYIEEHQYSEQKKMAAQAATGSTASLVASAPIKLRKTAIASGRV